MIVRPKPTLWDVMFTLKGSIAQSIAIRLLVITLVAILVTMLSQHDPAQFARLSATPFTLIGLSLSIFMSFRNSASYERWWEGRRQWGTLLCEIRSLIRESAAVGDDDARVSLLRGVCGFCHALAARLRDLDEARAARSWLDPTIKLGRVPNVPDAALATAGRALDDLVARGRVDA